MARNRRVEDEYPIAKREGYKTWQPKQPPALAVGICPKCGGPRKKARCWECYINGRLLRGKEVPECAQEALAEKRRKQEERKKEKLAKKRLRNIKKTGNSRGKNAKMSAFALRRARAEQLFWAVEMLNYFTGCFEVVDDGRYVVYEDVTNSEQFNKNIREVRATIPPLLKMSRSREERKKEIIAASKEEMQIERNKRVTQTAIERMAKAREVLKEKRARDKQEKERWAF